MHSAITMLYTVYCADTVFLVPSLFNHVVLEKVYIFHGLIDIVYGEQILALGTVLADDLHARLWQLLKVPLEQIYRYGTEHNSHMFYKRASMPWMPWWKNMIYVCPIINSGSHCYPLKNPIFHPYMHMNMNINVCILVSLSCPYSAMVKNVI